MAKTIREALTAGFTALGYQRIPSPTRRYEVFSLPGDSRKFFVGRSGALRVGRIAAESIPVSPQTRERIMAATTRNP